MLNVRWLVIPALLLSGCGGGKSPPKEPEPIVVEKPKPKPPPPPPPVCVRAGETMSLVGMVEADDAMVKFCVSDGAESNLCYGVDISEGGTKKYSELTEAPKGAPAVLDPNPARVETTNTEVKICKGEECKAFKPKVGKLANEIDAVINATGTYAAILLGNAEKGKGTVEVYSAAKPKKATASIKYAKGDYKCGEARMLGDTVFISASECEGQSARGWLYTVKGKKVADVGGKDFGTYGTVPIQLTETTWAFLEERARTVVIQDVVTGKIERTVEVWTPMAAEEGGLDGAEGEAPAEEDAAPPEEDMAAPPLSNPGESAMVRGAENMLVVVSGGPMPGSVAVIGTVHGIVTTINSLVCEPSAAPPEEEESADLAEGGEEAAADSEEGGE